MKKLLMFSAICLLFASCIKLDDLEPDIEDYTCQCTYIATSGGPSDGQPNKEETTNVRSESLGGAKVDCSQREDKYSGQWFEGTCIIQ